MTYNELWNLIDLTALIDDVDTDNINRMLSVINEHPALTTELRSMNADDLESALLELMERIGQYKFPTTHGIIDFEVA